MKMVKVAVIGAKGTVGRTLVEYFTTLGHEVLSVDKDTSTTLRDATALANVIFIVTLPIEEVASLISEVVSAMRPGTLLVHGTSIEKPIPQDIKSIEALSRGVTFCHFHFQFRPEMPLGRTLFGQHITMSIYGAKKRK